MIANYIRIAIRNIRQNPTYALINISSLSIGVAACIVIYLFISDERSFDAWHSKRASIYRLNETQNFTGTNYQKVALTGSPMGPVVLNEFPEVQNYARFWGGSKRVLNIGVKQFLVEQVATVDSSFLHFFDFELLHGDRSTVLDEPNSMVLSEATARKFFPSLEEAVGQTISKRDRLFKVTGIIKDVPENSHLQFDVLESMSTYEREDSTWNVDWGGNFLVTYLFLKPNTDPKKLEAKFPEWLVRWTGDADIGKSYTLYLQPFSEVHLGSTDIEHDYQNYKKFNGAYLGVFFIAGIFILLIASVNFMNLTTARASHRWKEIGVRTSVGARKGQLFGQFIMESIFLAVIALGLALLLDFILIPFLNLYIGRELLISKLIMSPSLLGILLFIAVGLGFLTGIYPSLYMTSANTISILKGGGKTGGKSIFRSSLVIVQFGLAIAMLVSTVIVVRQLSFMQNKDVGFNADQMLLVELDREGNKKFDALKTELSRSPYILGVTASGQRIGNNFHQWGFKVKADTGIITMAPSNVNVDYDYLKVYGIKLKDGRDFSKDMPSDRDRAFIVNETMVKHLGLKDPIGTPVGHGWFNNDSLGTIIGVTSDFNFNSLHHKVNTLSIVCHPQWGYDELSIKIDGKHIQEAIADARRIWEQQITSFPFTYTFLDDHMGELYKADQQMSSVVTIMAGLAILISCMGLFGLTMIATERKIKEIGIRKTLGANEFQITWLLSRQFTALIAVAFVLVSPLTYYLLSAWLETFAFRIGISPFYFFLGGLLALSIAILTISYHTIRAARANPVKALRYE